MIDSEVQFEVYDLMGRIGLPSGHVMVLESIQRRMNVRWDYLLRHALIRYAEDSPEGQERDLWQPV